MRGSDAKQLIQDSLIGLLEETPLEKVTTTDIIDAAHISRFTFYYHYQNKNEVVDDLIERVLGLCAPPPLQRDEIPAFIDEYLHLVESNQALYRVLVTNNLLPKAVDAYMQRYHPLILKLPVPMPIENADISLYSKSRATAIETVVTLWVQNGCKEPRESVLRVIEALINPSDRR